MSSRRRTTINNLVGLTANAVILAVQSIVLVPRFIKVIGEATYGAWVSSGDLFQWMSSLDLGLTNVMIQRIAQADGKKDSKAIGEEFCTTAALMAVICVILGLAGVAISSKIPGWFALNPADTGVFSEAFLIGAISTAAFLFNNVLIGYGRAVQRTGVLNITSFLSILLSLVVTVAMLKSAGLLAIAYGLAVRTLVAAVGGAVFLVVEVPKDVWKHFHFSKPVFSELLKTIPFSAIGGLSYIAMNQSELLIAGSILGKETALMLFVTRRAIDLAKALSDTITFATYGGFSHLVGSDQRGKSLTMYRQILSVRVAFSVSLCCAYIVANAGFVTLWVSNKNFGGLLITVLIALQVAASGTSYFINYFYRATGQQIKGSGALAIEAIARTGLSILSAHLFGLVGLVSSGIIVSVVLSVVYHRWLTNELAVFCEEALAIPWQFWMSCVGSTFGSVGLGVVLNLSSWAGVLGIGIAVFLLSLGLMVAVNPLILQLARRTKSQAGAV